MTSPIKDFADNTDLRALVEAHGCALKKSGADWWGLCPFHAENTPSFSVYQKNKRWRFKCFGCGVAGDAFDFVRLIHGCRDNREALACINALPVPKQQPAPEPKQKKDTSAYARKLWQETLPAHGSPVEFYLRKRGIELDPLPSVLRFHPDLKHPEGQTFPAMVACIHNHKNEITGIHRTFITPEGHKAPVEKTKLALGGFSGGAIHLYPAGPVLGVAEGIETALSVRQHNPDLPVWAAISLTNMKALIFPKTVQEVIYLADADSDRHTLMKILGEGAERLRAEGREVTIAQPWMGTDFNDMAQGERHG